MKQSIVTKMGVVVLVMALSSGYLALAQAPNSQPQPAQAPSATDKAKASEVTPLTLDVTPTPPPVNAEEDAAMKELRDTPNSDLEKKEQMAESFLQKYPQSRYRPELFLFLEQAYLSTGQADKLEATGNKALEMNPNDAITLATVGFSIPRAVNPKTPDAQKRWDKAEQYCKKALDILPTLPKPEDAPDDKFVQAKNQAAAMAYSGLGVTAFRRGNYAEAITNLNQAVRMDAMSDPVNYYILGIANQKTAHYEDAAAAFTKCAASPGGLQSSCKSGIEEAKKLATTQLSAPK